LRWLVTIVGYVIVLITALGLFAVPVQHLVLGGALTGVIVGIAAQQALGNVFAGVVLLLARPFSVGDAIRIKSGSLGGVTEGTVSAMGMTYVTVITEEGPLSVPNSGLLAAAVGPMPGTAYSRSRRFDLSGTETGAALGRPGSGVLRLGRVVGRPPHRLAADAVARRSWRGVVPLQRRSGGQPWNAVRSARARRMNQRSASAGQSASATA
jgi:hypothetical protein